MSPLDLERIDGVPIAHVHEDIDAANAANAQQQLADALDPDTSRLVVDLSDTRYLDSAGIDMLLRLGDRLDHRRAKLDPRDPRQLPAEAPGHDRRPARRDRHPPHGRGGPGRCCEALAEADSRATLPYIGRLPGRLPVSPLVPAAD